MVDREQSWNRRRALHDSDALARLALDAEPVFASHAELLDWLSCVARRWLGAAPSRRGCDAEKAAACAIVGGAACRFAASARALEAHLAGLPTRRLEALLLLELEARRAGEVQPPGG